MVKDLASDAVVVAVESLEGEPKSELGVGESVTATRMMKPIEVAVVVG